MSNKRQIACLLRSIPYYFALFKSILTAKKENIIIIENFQFTYNASEYRFMQIMVQYWISCQIRLPNYQNSPFFMQILIQFCSKTCLWLWQVSRQGRLGYGWWVGIVIWRIRFHRCWHGFCCVLNLIIMITV